mmetsp:Transcript_6951/g.6470  ORF Transcript_6951/g.6470 Transcript_6951/m.6470 type:complete len:305 (+) Transcript_6951:1087-2001(+)
MAFSSSAISSGKITAKINNLNLVNGNFTCPIRSDNSDKSLQSMELEVTHKLQMINATILRPASDFRLKVNEFEMKHSGKIIYGNDALWLDVSQKFNISGLIFPYDLSYGEATSTSNPKVFVLAGIKAPQPPPSTEEEDPDFIFGKASGIMGKSIQIFSDKNITIKGNLNNYYITHDKQLKLVQSCITVNPGQTEFTDVFRCVNQGLKGSKLSQTMLIDQFNTQFESEKPVEQYSELFTKMTKDYSIYIQSLGTVHLSGNLTGNRVGLCSSNLTITGIINTTEGGCPHDKGVLQPSDNKPSTTNV